MTDPELFAGFDQEQLDDYAGRLLKAITAVLEFGALERGGDAVFHAAMVKALIFAQAALIVQPPLLPRIDDDAVLALHDAALRHAVADFRSGS